MATEKRLIDVDSFRNEPVFDRHHNSNLHDPYCAGYHDALDRVEEFLDIAPTVDAIELPCKIGDFVWAIRNFKGKKHPQRGVVSDMFFNKRMELIIVVKYVARGEWGKAVFATDKEAYAAIGERRTNE